MTKEILPACPKCGSPAYIHHDFADFYDMGWSVGCPRYCHNDGIHGTTPDTPKQDTYAIHYLNSRAECIKKWNERVNHLEGKE